MNREVLEKNGGAFELKISSHLNYYFREAYVLHDKHLYSPYLCRNTQIDLILICTKGIFVIEAKKWGIYIKGTRNDRYWEGKSTPRNTIRQISPVDQNFMHIRALRNRLRTEGYNPPLFRSIVCFPNGTSLETDCEEVMTLTSMVRHIASMPDIPFNGKFWCSAISKVCTDRG